MMGHTKILVPTIYEVQELMLACLTDLIDLQLTAGLRPFSDDIKYFRTVNKNLKSQTKADVQREIRNNLRGNYNGFIFH